MERLSISDNKRYLMQGDRPFFWLGDTAWLIFGNITEEEAYVYLKNRADKGFNVIQAVLVYSTPDMEVENKMYWEHLDIRSEEYWERVDRIIKLADGLGLYMAVLPCWGSLVKTGRLNMSNVDQYAEFLIGRYASYDNIIWVLGGDIKAADYKELYCRFGKKLKDKMPDKLITFHPFGRTSSAEWFVGEDWLDIHMFQSGHRRYDQLNMGAWDDVNSPGFYGEDNWRYVLYNLNAEKKPTLDAEPSYEWIPQGLHDKREGYWTARDVRRYAYWSVLSGACGFTYGDNAVMQFYHEGSKGINYDPICDWDEGIHHEGSGEMQHLKALIESVDYHNGRVRDDLIVGGQRERHARIAVFADDARSFIIAYDYSGATFSLNLSGYEGREIYYVSPVTGARSFLGICKGEEMTFKPIQRVERNLSDRIYLIINTDNKRRGI